MCGLWMQNVWYIKSHCDNFSLFQFTRDINRCNSLRWAWWKQRHPIQCFPAHPFKTTSNIFASISYYFINPSDNSIHFNIFAPARVRKLLRWCVSPPARSTRPAPTCCPQFRLRVDPGHFDPSCRPHRPPWWQYNASSQRRRPQSSYRRVSQWF